MKQEGRLFCIEKLSEFDGAKSSRKDVGAALLTFLKIIVRRHYINLRRNKFQRAEPPSCSCPLCTTDSADRPDCPKYAAWLKRNLSKRSLVEPFNVEDIYR